MYHTLPAFVPPIPLCDVHRAFDLTVHPNANLQQLNLKPHVCRVGPPMPQCSANTEVSELADASGRSGSSARQHGASMHGSSALRSSVATANAAGPGGPRSYAIPWSASASMDDANDAGKHLLPSFHDSSPVPVSPCIHVHTPVVRSHSASCSVIMLHVAT